MNTANKFVRLTKDLPLDPEHGCLKGTVWEITAAPEGQKSGPKTWILAAAGRAVALLRHEWEEAGALALGPCPSCKRAGEVVPGIKRGLFIAQCSGKSDCEVYPMTDPFHSEEEAADAWRRGAFSRTSAADLANAE